MFDTAAEALGYIRSNDIQFLDLVYTDMVGRNHHVTVPTAHVSEQTFREGEGMDGSSVGLARLESGDMCVVPDPGACYLDPSAAHPTLGALCDVVTADTKELVPFAPRSIARRAAAFLQQSGVATRSLWGPELEYHVFDRVTVDDRPERVGYALECAEIGWGGEGPRIPTQRGYHAARPEDRLHDLRSETARRLEAAGIEVKLHHHEVGAAGQVELELGFADLLRSCDNVVLSRTIARLTAAEMGYRATFLPKPIFGQAGSGLHFHQHLFHGSDPVFFEEGGYADLSPVALSYVAGLLRHGSAVLAFTNPSTNSYRRLVPGFEAPVRAFFSLANRSAAIRVPRYARAPEQKRIEFRPPDATCNPYLALPAMLLAGLDGVQQGLDPTALGFGPFDVNAERLPPADRDRIASLPTSLSAAADALQANHGFLTDTGVFDDGLIEGWLHHLRAQVRAIAARPHPYEFALHLDV